MSSPFSLKVVQALVSAGTLALKFSLVNANAMIMKMSLMDLWLFTLLFMGLAKLSHLMHFDFRGI